MDEATRPEAVEIIRSMIERIDVHPGAKPGECAVILVGALAQILAFTQQKKNAASIEAAVPDRFRRSVKVVAGARNRLNLLFNARIFGSDLVS